MSTRNDYTTAEAIAFEDGCLSVGRDLIAEHQASGRTPEPAAIDGLDFFVELDQRAFSRLDDAIAAFSRAASCFGGYAPRIFGEIAETAPQDTSPEFEADHVASLAKAANNGAWAEHEFEGSYNPPAMLEVKDTRGTAGVEGVFVRVLWGTGRSVVTLEQVTDENGELSDWWVSVGYQERAGRDLDVVTTAHALRRSSVVLSMAERVKARDKDLHDAGGSLAELSAKYDPPKGGAEV
jgi:hypothetical protein